MTKYRIRLPGGRVIGPFVKDQLFELKSKGHITGKEEAQIFPTGEWKSISSLDFYAELFDTNRTKRDGVPSVTKEDTFVFDLAKLKGVEEIVTPPTPDEPTPTVVEELSKTEIILEEKPVPNADPMVNVELVVEPDPDKSAVDIEALLPTVQTPKKEESNDKTTINPEAQRELAKLREKQKADEKARKKQEEENEIRRKETEALALKLAEEEKDESTRMISLDVVKSELLETAGAAEQEIEIVEKKFKKKKKEEEAARLKEEEDEDEDEEEEDGGKKKVKLILVMALLALGYAFLFPEEEKKKPPFKHVPVVIEFPISAEVADTKAAKVHSENANELFNKGGYTNLVKAGVLFKQAYENDIEDVKSLNMMTRVYAEELPSSKEKNIDGNILFNIIQSKRAYLLNNPDGIIGVNLFYRTIGKKDAAVDFVSKYLRLNAKNVTPDLFATYITSLIEAGRVDIASDFFKAVIKAPKKSRYVYDAIIKFYTLNNEFEKAQEYLDEAIKNNPDKVYFMLDKADVLFKQSKFQEVANILRKTEELNLEYNDIYRAKFLALTAFLAAEKKDVKTATMLFKKSLEVHESDELRSMLAKLDLNEATSKDTKRLIEESKAIKRLEEAKNFYRPGNYQLAWSKAEAVAYDYPDFIPAQLFLSNVQVKLGFIEDALKILSALVKKHPENKEINFAMAEAYINTYKFHDAKNQMAMIAGTDMKKNWEFASLNARLFSKMGESLQAMSWYKASMQLNPINDQDIFRLVEILIRRAKFDNAKQLLNKAIELDPLNPEYRIAYSKIVYETEDDQAAIGYLLSILKDFPDNPKILAEIAIFYSRAGKVKDFEAYKKKLEAFKGKDKTLQEFLIRSALLDERYKEIPDLVEDLLKVEPGDLESMMTAGRVLFENGKLVESALWFKRVQKKLNTYPKVQFYLAKIKMLAGEIEDPKDKETGVPLLDEKGQPVLGAKNLILKDIKENGENDVSLVLLAQILTAQEQIVDAENTYKKALKMNAKSYEALAGLADISVKRSNLDIALDLYQKALNIKGDEPSLHKKMGDVYRLLGQGTLAIESYKMYLETNPDAVDKGQVEAFINLLQ